MEKRGYCVYNPTSECFLSLGVTRDDRGFARVKGWLRRRAPRYDEGHWLTRPRWVRLLSLFSSRDLVFLDAKDRVLQVIESSPPFRFVSIDEKVASVLELPIHTIDSSQTQPGNQRMIGVAEEMVFRLRSMQELEKDDFVGLSAFGIIFAPQYPTTTTPKRPFFANSMFPMVSHRVNAVSASEMANPTKD